MDLKRHIVQPNFVWFMIVDFGSAKNLLNVLDQRYGTGKQSKIAQLGRGDIFNRSLNSLLKDIYSFLEI